MRRWLLAIYPDGWRVWAWIAVIVAVTAYGLTGCTSGATQTSIATSGEALVGVGNTFVAVGGVYQAQCMPAPKVATVAQFCTGFKAFAPKFQSSYPQAVQAWKIARAGNDSSKALAATDTILQLSSELTALAIQVIGKVQ